MFWVLEGNALHGKGTINGITREIAIAHLTEALEDDNRLAYRSALREVAEFAPYGSDESRSIKFAIQREHRADHRDRPHHLVSEAILALAGFEPAEPEDMDYLISSL